MATYTDEELVSMMKTDDEKSFGILYDRYWKSALYKAYTILGSHTDAEEIVQDVFVNLWNKRHSLKLRYTFKTYISAIVRYEVYAKIAGAKKIKDQAGIVSEGLELIDDSTRQWLEFEELRRYIELEMDALPEKCRLVFSLSRFEELSNDEIAKSLGLSKKTVEAHITKALKALRENMNNVNAIEALLMIYFLRK